MIEERDPRETISPTMIARAKARGVPLDSTPEHFGLRCTCPAQAGACNLTDCQQPWADAYRRKLRPRWYERIAGFFAAFIAWGRR